MLLVEYSWADIGGVRLDGAPAEYPYRGIGLSRLTGWRGLPGMRGGLDMVPGAHGAFSTEALLRDPRSMALNGFVEAGTPAEALVMLERLESALAASPVQLRVAGDDGEWTRVVEVEALIPEDTWNRKRIRFSVDLIAPDPVRYREWLTAGPVGLPTQVGGLVLPKAFPWDFGTSTREVATVANDGSVPVLPRVTVTGSADALTLFGGARRLEFGPFDGVLVFDSLERRAFLNGADVTRQLIRRDWPVVDPGGVADFYFQAVDPSSDINLMVEYRIGAW